MKLLHLSLMLGLALASLTATAAEKRLLLIAGKQSHGPGDHEFRAGCLLLQKCLAGVPGLRAEVHTNGWPASDTAFEGVDAVFIYADGGGGHPAIQSERIKLIDALAKKGVGLGFGHYGVEVPAGAPGEAMHRWVGGYYEHQFSVNPMWTPEYRTFPNHPIARGVRPFALLDEWYFNMRWRADGQGLTHLLVAKPSDAVRDGPYVYPQGPYKHIQEAKGRDETMMWAFERPDGGRGFGFTGGHKHVNWANDNYRKVLLNALLWIAKAEVPAAGVESKLAPEELAQNLDPKGMPADAPNITGHWRFKVETSAGSGSPTFTFVHAGQNLIGTYSGFFGEAELSGSVSKDQNVRFSFRVSRDGQEGTVTYTGKVESPTAMKGTVKFGDLGEGTWTATK
ncbi:MAG: ThuA domain-containing protein [Verrucomicrobia bacterium]|nr:ThuA domain-containing protein [Verrucomicrobiota bacterium]